MSYAPPTLRDEYLEACSRAVLLTRLALHTYATGHNKLRSDYSTEDFANTLRAAASEPLSWSNEQLEATLPLLGDMSSCSHPACQIASTQGPIALKRTLTRFLEAADPSGRSTGLDPTLGDVMTLLQKILTVGKLQHSGWKTDRLSALLPNSFSPFDIAAAKEVLKNSDLHRLQPRPGPHREGGETEEAYNRAFTGNIRAITQDRSLWQTGNTLFSTPETLNPSWSLGSVSTAHLSGAAWTKQQASHFSYP